MPKLVDQPSDESAQDGDPHPDGYTRKDRRPAWARWHGQEVVFELGKRRSAGETDARARCDGGRSNGAPGGSGGIRTHGRVSPSPVFKTGAFNRSATLPGEALSDSLYRRPTGRRQDQRSTKPTSCLHIALSLSLSRRLMKCLPDRRQQVFENGSPAQQDLGVGLHASGQREPLSAVFDDL